MSSAQVFFGRKEPDPQGGRFKMFAIEVVVTILRIWVCIRDHIYYKDPKTMVPLHTLLFANPRKMFFAH